MILEGPVIREESAQENANCPHRILTPDVPRSREATISRSRMLRVGHGYASMCSVAMRHYADLILEERRIRMLRHLFIALTMAVVSGFSVNAMALDFGNMFSKLDDAVAQVWVCPHPVEAVLNTLDCVEQENAVCAAAGYAPNFVKLHNDEDTETEMSMIFWLGGFYLLDFQLDYSRVEQIDVDEVLLEYVETVTTREGEVFLQHETAFVTVNSACQIELWDQYGDDAEQQAVDDAVADQMPDFF